MTLAEDKLGIPRILDASILSNPDVDDISVMTYLSYFCKPANERLMRWIQSKVPDRKVANFTTDWNTGVNLACLVDSISPGVFPSARDLDPHDALENLVRAMRVGEDHLSVKPVIKPSEMADPLVDELNVATYLFRFQYAKPVPQPHEVTCSGHGLYKAFVGRPAHFEVNAARAGVGDLAVTIKGSTSRPISADITASKERRGVFAIQYVPQSPGKLSIGVKWSGFEIPASPFAVDVLDPASLSFTGAQITGGQAARVGKPVVMYVKGLIDVSDLYVLIQHPDAHSEVAKIVPKGTGEADVSYTPVRVGKDEVFAKVAGEDLPGSPFEVQVVDPTHCSVSLKDPPPGKPLPVNQKATFVVNASEANMDGIIVEASTPAGIQELSVTRSRDGTHSGTFTPVEVGAYAILVTCAGESIRGSPLNLPVCDASRCTVLDATPQYMQVSKHLEINISTKNAGPGALEAFSSNAGILGTSVKKVDQELFSLSLLANVVGESTVDLKWNETSVPQTPFAVSVCDASKCSAYGQGLTGGKGKVGESFAFTVQTAQAGKGELLVKPKGPKSTYKPNVKPNQDDTFTVSFTTYEQGPHSIEILWGNSPIPNSPYVVQFTKGADAGLFTATGDGLKTAVALETAKCMLVGPESGLVKNGVLVVEIAGAQLHSKLVDRSVFSPKCGQLVVSVTDNSNGSYAVQYTAPKAGTYALSFTSDGEHVPGSPFQVNVLPPPDASRCTAYGPAIDSPRTQVVGKALEFKVDSTDAGTGQLSIAASSPISTSMPVYLAEDKTGQNKRIHNVKIEPKVQGKHMVHVLWAGQHIPGSPFSFEISDPKNVAILNLPPSEEYKARVGEPFTFTVDPRKAGLGEVKAAAQLEGGRVDPLEVKPKQDGKIDLRYVPRSPGKMELLLTFSGVSLLHLPWTCDIANPGQYRILAPQGYGRQREYVKFVVGGLTKKNQKNVSLTAVHKEHNAAVKVDFGKDGQAVARFTAKQKGKYTIEAKCANTHIQGSPFTVQVANPEGCMIKGEVPAVLPVGQTRMFTVDTTSAGPGELTYAAQTATGDTSSCLGCEVRVKATAANAQQVVLKGLACAECEFVLKWAGYVVQGTPQKVVVVDPEKCAFLCPQAKSGSIKQGETVLVVVDTSKGGNCIPEVVAKGPKASYEVDLKSNKAGKFSATFNPWQDGEHTLEVYVGGVHVSESPVTFEVIKPIDPTKITITGSGTKQAIANRPAEVTVFARESKLFDKGILVYQFTSKQEAVDVPKVECHDNGNGTYRLTYIPHAAGNLQLKFLSEGKAISGSPFSIQVRPEPNAKMCKISGIAVDDPDHSHLLHDTVELTVDSTDAGCGALTVSANQPNGTPFSVFTRDEQVGNKSIHFLKFDAAMVGSHTVSVLWDKEHIPGSPYKIQVTDPSKCIIDGPTPRYMIVGRTNGLLIGTSGAGSGKLEVSLSSLNPHPPVKATIEEKSPENYQVNLSALEIGEAKVTITIGQQKVPKTPFTLSVCDPSQCSVDSETLKSMNVFVGVPFKFPVHTNDAGTAVLTVKPDDSEGQCTAEAKNMGSGKWEVSCTATTIGLQKLHIFYGEVPIPCSPATFTASDPKKCIVTGLHKNYVATMGKPVPFSVDYSQAGKGELRAKMRLPDGSMEEVEREDRDGVAALTYTPKQPGQLELILEFNSRSILPSSWSCLVPDPSRFLVTPPSGYGKLKESVRFPITGVTETSRDISVSAIHGKYSFVVKTDPSDEPGVIIANFTAKEVGEYTVHVKHMDQHIDGSPFKVHVAHPNGCTIFGHIPKTVHIGERQHLNIDASNSGPGVLTCTTEVLSGEMVVASEVSKDEEENHKLSISSETIGRARFTVKWAEHVIPQSPFEVSFLDAGNVKWSCQELESGRVKQGETVEIQVDCKDAGESAPEMKAFGPKSSYNIETNDNQDGTFTMRFYPWQIGQNSVEILWGGRPILATPIVFEVVKAIEARAITASGEGLRNAIAGTPTKVKITTPEPGLLEQGILSAKFILGDTKDETDSETPCLEFTDREDGTYSLTYTVPVEGKYHLAITYEDHAIAGSPFTVLVHRAPSASHCRAFGGSLATKLGLLVVDPIQFSVDTTDAGKGHLTVTATQPNERQIPVYALEETAAKRKLHHLKFDPEFIGHHTVNVLWEDEHISGSPFDFNVISPSKCKVKGLPLPNDIAQLGEGLQFTVIFKEAGHDVAPEVFASLPGEGELLTLRPTPLSNAIFGYEYTADMIGSTSITVQYGGHDVIGSPFNFQVIDASRLYITGLNLTGGYAYVCDPVTFNIVGQVPGDQRLMVAAHGPSSDPNVDVTEPENGLHVATFVPPESGSYEVYVECARVNVSGSPFTVNVADWSKCQVLGDLPATLQVGKPVEFVVKTRSAGAGDLSALLDHSADNPVIDCSIEKQGLDSFGVTLLGKRIGKVEEIELQWAGHNISECPFRVSVCDARQCKAYGQALKTKRGKVSESVTFTVVALHAGEGDLTVVPRGPSAQYNVDIRKTKEATYEVSFTPWEVGQNVVQVSWGGAAIPHSPFMINIESPTSSSVCNATGEGLTRAIAGEPASFTIISSEIGLLDKNAFKVTVFGPGVQSAAEVKITDNNNGTYTVQYTAPVAGGYIASISFYDRPIPGSPFKVNVVPGPDASKCRAYGPALHPNATNISGTLEFYVDASKGGDGSLKVYIQGPNDYRPEVYIADDIKKRKNYSIKFDAKKAGKYMIVVLWAKQHIPGSPFKLKVHQQPNAAKVKAYGPGLEGGATGDKGMS